MADGNARAQSPQKEPGGADEVLRVGCRADGRQVGGRREEDKTPQ